jgi:hypothetical protein
MLWDLLKIALTRFSFSIRGAAMSGAMVLKSFPQRFV